MTAVLEPIVAQNLADLALVRGVSVLHLPSCPHIARFREVVPATEPEIATMSVCNWSQAEIDGFGRTYFDTVEEAMDAFQSSPEAREIVRAEIKDLAFDSVWIPYSRSYIALGRDGLAVGWILRTIIDLAGRVIELPDYAPRSRSIAGDSERRGPVCSTCWMEMSVSGVCNACD